MGNASPWVEGVRFSEFIKGNLDAIVAEWVTFARTLLPSAKAMSALALQDHARDMLLAIAKDMETSQTLAERSIKSKQMELAAGVAESSASAHGALRQLAGFDLSQLVGEFRAMRASVLAMWRRSDPSPDSTSAIEEIARFNEGIDQAMAESVERYSSDIATFLAVIGHDLRSPLFAIQGSSEMLSTRTLSEAVRQEAMVRIFRSSKVMAHLINDLLEYTGLQLGRGIPVRLDSCDMREVCEEALDTIRAIHPKQEFAATFSGELRLKADALRMQQVLSNLLNNAFHHGDQRSPVTLSAAGDQEAVILKVTNRGKPIPSNALQAIFEPMVQMPAAKSEPHQAPYTSLGLGLFIVREIVHRHQGEITVQSGLDAGTVFTIRLPRSVQPR